MNYSSVTRRGFLGGLGGLTIATSSARASSANSSEISPGNILEHKGIGRELIRDIGVLLLEAPGNAKSLAIDIAAPIAEAYQVVKESTSEVLPDSVDDIFDINGIKDAKGSIDLTIKHVRPLYKFFDVFDDTLGVKLPTLPLYRMLLLGADISTIGGLIIAGRALGEAAVSVVSSTEDSGTITNDESEGLYYSLFLFGLETIFLAFPLNFKFAWRGTRWATNNLLFRLRDPRLGGNKMLALVMSFVHWVLRDVPRESAANLNQVPELANYVYQELKTRASEIENVEPPSFSEVNSLVNKMVRQDAYELDL